MSNPKWEALVQWVKDAFGPMPTAVADPEPFEYITKTSEQLEIGDYIVAYSGYVQRLGAVEYDGKRLVVTKSGHSPEYEFYAYENDKFSIRKVKGKSHGY
ncbi:hypothetical protein [Escherichia phage Lidtsur]|uniref:Uncharacterized protein n=1 Tax=Escherichia phage Lidtsur TaxID=2562235 RepID=A0A4D6DYX4_9CAUD|nr:hypothetical protein HOV34_gp16 [Escherichia phage Lidtsur]QBZ71520.1 hypothetical protein [Escherichia phage Lidtsur]